MVIRSSHAKIMWVRIHRIAKLYWVNICMCMYEYMCVWAININNIYIYTYYLILYLFIFIYNYIVFSIYLVSYIYTKPFSPEVLPSRNCCFTLKPLPGWGPQTTEPSEKFCLSTFSKYVSNVGATKNIASLTMGIERSLQPVDLFQNCSLQAVVKPGCLKWYNCMDYLPRVSLSFQSLFFR